VADDSLLDDRRLPDGRMAPYLGPQFPLEAVRSAEDYVEDERVQRFVRAYPVPSLSGVEIVADSDSAIGDALLACLNGQLAGIDWQPDRDLIGPLRKYGLLHASLLAPPDGTTGQPMSLEICGILRSAGDVIVDDWKDFFDYRDTLGDGYMSIPLPGPVVIRLENAVYANVLFPGIGMPFYS
jgi:hypothetical protein